MTWCGTYGETHAYFVFVIYKKQIVFAVHVMNTVHKSEGQIDTWETIRCKL